MAPFFAAPAHAYNPSLAFNPPSYDFGAMLPGAGPSPPKVFTLTNTGELSLTLDYTAVEWGPQEFAEPEMFKITSNNCRTLAPGASCSIGVAFNPVLPGPKWGTVSVAAPFGANCNLKDECQPVNVNAQLHLTGSAQTVSLSPSSLTFLPLMIGMGPSSQKTVTVTNQGEFNLKVFQVMLTDRDSNQFRLSGGTCSAEVILPPGGACTVNVAFSPSAPGTLTTNLTIIDDAVVGQQSATLEGEGVAEAFHLQSPPALQVLLLRRPDDSTPKRKAVFWFKGSTTAVRFECKLDWRPFVPCQSPARFEHLSVGRHYFAVRAIDANGNHSPDGAARYRWRIGAER